MPDGSFKLAPPSPHGPLEEVFDGIWFVRGGVKMPMLVPVKMGRAMTVLRDESGGLTLVNSMRLSEDGLAALDRLGSVENVIRVAGFHGRDDGFYRDRYGARVFAVAGQRYVRGMSFDVPADKDYMRADEYLDESSELPIPNARLKVFSTCNPPEGALLLEREGGVLITGDSLQHTPKADEYTNFMAKIMLKKFGFFVPYNVGPGWLQFASPTAEEVRSVLDLEFEHVLPGHGEAVLGGAREKFRPSLMSELKGCHTP